jgi:hypothetical protein
LIGGQEARSGFVGGGELLGVGVGVLLAVGVGLVVALGLDVGVTDGVGVGVLLAVGVGDGVGVARRVTLGRTIGVGVDVGDGEAVAVGCESETEQVCFVEILVSPHCCVAGLFSPRKYIRQKIAASTASMIKEVLILNISSPIQG